MLGGAIRVSTPFMFVALGECLTEKSGRVNLGLEGTLVLGAMVAYALSYHTGSPWVGVSRRRASRARSRRDARVDLRSAEGQRCRGRHRHDAVRRRHRVLLRQALHPADGAAAGAIPLRLLERQPEPRARSKSIRCSSSASSLAIAIAWAMRNTRWGLVVRTVGDSAAAARAMGISVNLVRLMTTTVGGFLAGVGGAFSRSPIPAPGTRASRPARA